jgi:hypothetical protein
VEGKLASIRNGEAMEIAGMVYCFCMPRSGYYSLTQYLIPFPDTRIRICALGSDGLPGDEASLSELLQRLDAQCGTARDEIADEIEKFRKWKV